MYEMITVRIKKQEENKVRFVCLNHWQHVFVCFTPADQSLWTTVGPMRVHEDTYILSSCLFTSSSFS